jgi:hypothetical protein
MYFKLIGPSIQLFITLINAVLSLFIYIYCIVYKQKVIKNAEKKNNYIMIMLKKSIRYNTETLHFFMHACLKHKNK